MVSASMYIRYLKEKEIREKRLLEKEEKKRKEEIEKYKAKSKPHIWSTKRKKSEEFIFTEEEKEICREKTLDQLVDEIGGSQLVCPPGKELKKDINIKELTADLTCFRKRVRKKRPEEIVALYDRLLAADPERLCRDSLEDNDYDKR